MSSTSTTSTEFSLKHIFATARQLEQSVIEFDLDQAKIEASSLSIQSQRLAKSYFYSPSVSENPLPIAQKTLSVLSNDNAVLCLELKKTLSKTCRTFFECVLFKIHSSISNIRIPHKMKTAMLEKAKTALCIVPTESVELKYDLTCIEGAIKALESPSERKQALIDFFKSFANMEFGDLLEPMRQLWDLEFQAGPWFSTSIYWRWLAAGVKDLDDVKLLDKEIASTKETGCMFVQSKAVVYADLLERTGSTEVKSFAIEKLIQLLDSNHWEVRRIAAQHLSMLVTIPHEPDLEKIYIALTTLILSEEKFWVLYPVVLAYLAVSRRAPDDQNLWKKAILTANVESDTSQQIQRVLVMMSTRKGDLSKNKIERSNRLTVVTDKVKEYEQQRDEKKKQRSDITTHSAGKTAKLTKEINAIEREITSTNRTVSQLQREIDGITQEISDLEDAHELFKELLTV